MLHARSFDQPQITGSLNQITQSIRKSYLCLFVRCETQLSHQGSDCQQNRHSDQHIECQLRAVAVHLSDRNRTGIDRADKFDRNVKIGSAMVTVRSDPAHQGIAAFLIVVAGG